MRRCRRAGQRLAGPGFAGIDTVTGKRLWLCGTCGTKHEPERLRTKFLGQVDDKKASRTERALALDGRPIEAIRAARPWLADSIAIGYGWSAKPIIQM